MAETGARLSELVAGTWGWQKVDEPFCFTPETNREIRFDEIEKRWHGATWGVQGGDKGG
jgi:hypothetical protein